MPLIVVLKLSKTDIQATVFWENTCRYRNTIITIFDIRTWVYCRSLTKSIPRHFGHVCTFMHSTYRHHWLVCKAGSDWRRRTSDVVVSESRKWCRGMVPRSRSNTRCFCER